ncbi:MAG: hypothetical protein ACRC4L_03215 [Mycoplasma sp.]
METEKLNNAYINNDKNIKVSSDTIFKPILSYLFYLFLRVFKMKSTYIIMGLTLVIAILLPFFVHFIAKFSTSANASHAVFLEAVNFTATIFAPWIPLTLIVMIGVFASVKGIQLFYDFQNEGTELLIVSKPIKRSQILIGKFTFLLLLGLVFSTLITLLSMPGIYQYTQIFKKHGVTPGGIFISSIASYIAMCLLSISISIASKSGGKIAKVLPNLILGLSVILVNIIPSVAPILTPSKQIKEFKDGFVKKVENDPDIKAISDIQIEYNTSSSFFYISNFNLETSDSEYVNFKYYYWGLQDPENPSDPQYNIQKQYHESLSIELSKYLEQKKGYPTTKGLNAFSYLNPVSAFMSMSGVNLSSSLSSMIPNSPPPYNLNMSNFKSKNNVSITDGLDYYLLPSVVKPEKITKIDNQLYVSLTWFGILGLLSGFVMFKYQRKDFK